jgi:hypothetical protein
MSIVIFIYQKTNEKTCKNSIIPYMFTTSYEYATMDMQIQGTSCRDLLDIKIQIKWQN